MNKLSEEEIIEIMEEMTKYTFCIEASKCKDAIQGLLDLYQKEKEKNIKAGELLGKRINMCNQFQIELDKEQEKNKELVNGQIDFWLEDKEIEQRIKENFISKDKIKAKIDELQEILDFVKTGKDTISKAQASILEKIIKSLKSLLEEE